MTAFDLFGEARAAVDRALAAQQAVNELVAPATDGGNQETADEGVRAGYAGVETGHVSGRTPNSPSADAGPGMVQPSPGPYTFAELEALYTSIWSLEDDGTDLTRFHELLHAALVFIGRIALAYPADWSVDAAALLRAMELRALWGPDHPVRQP